LHPVDVVIAADMTHQRKLVDDPATTVDDRGELVHGLQIVVRVRPRDGLVEDGLGFGVADGCRHRRDQLGIDGPIPGVERGSRRESGQQARIGQRHPQDCGLADFVGEALRPSRDREARAQAFQIPLPRPRQGLVEVVDVEDQPTFRGGEPAEVDQMRVAAQLHHDPCAGSGREVGGHARRCPAEEAELRLDHPSVTDRQELGHPALTLCLEHGDRVRPIRCRLPVSMVAAGHVAAQLPTGGDAVGAVDVPGVAAQHPRRLGGTKRPLVRSDAVRP
jgi:hypothetical protein